MSDHHTQILFIGDLSFENESSRCVYKRIFLKYKMIRFKQKLAELEWQSVYYCDGKDEAYETFCTIFDTYFDQVLYLKHIT